jgi:hypothetical protein
MDLYVVHLLIRLQGIVLTELSAATTLHTFSSFFLALPLCRFPSLFYSFLNQSERIMRCRWDSSVTTTAVFSFPSPSDRFWVSPSHSIELVRGAPFLGVGLPEREVYHLPPSSAECMELCLHSPYVTMVLYSVKHKDNSASRHIMHTLIKRPASCTDSTLQWVQHTYRSFMSD